MRAFVSYRHTGADPAGTKAMLSAVREALDKKSVAMSNTFFDLRDGEFEQASLSPVEFMRQAFEMIDRSDLLLVLQSSEERSEGMLMEVGYAIARQMPVVVATQLAVKGTYLPGMASLTLRWEDADDLARGLAEIDFESLKRG